MILEPNPAAEDEAYEAARQEKVDAENVYFPVHDILIARGKYSTLASERRELLKAMREDLEISAGSAGRTLRSPDDLEFVGAQIMSMDQAVERLKERYARLAIVRKALDELKPAAWGTKGNQHE